MAKFKLTQVEVDSIVVVERVVVGVGIRGVGLFDVGFKPYIDEKPLWQYRVWRNMLERCLSEKFKQDNLAYKGVTVCDEWLSFGNFLEWVNKEVDYSGKPSGFELDKDLIVKGNKLYSPEFCSFVPTTVNLLLVSNAATRGIYPVGVSFHKVVGRFRARLSCCGKVDYLGLFDNPQDAFQAYKTAKEAQIKLVALQYKDVLKPAVFESLMNWEILSDD